FYSVSFAEIRKCIMGSNEDLALLGDYRDLLPGVIVQRIQCFLVSRKIAFDIWSPRGLSSHQFFSYVGHRLLPKEDIEPKMGVEARGVCRIGNQAACGYELTLVNDIVGSGKFSRDLRHFPFQMKAVE